MTRKDRYRRKGQKWRVAVVLKSQWVLLLWLSCVAFSRTCQLVSTAHWCSLKKSACPWRSAEKSAGLCRQTDDHRRRVARVAGSAVHGERMHQGTGQSLAGAGCCQGSPYSMLARSAAKTGGTGLLPPPLLLPLGDAGVGRGRRPCPMGRRWDGCRRGTCSPLRPAVSSSTDWPPVFPPREIERVRERKDVSSQEAMCKAHKHTLQWLFTSRSSAVCLLLSPRREGKRSERLILSLFCHLSSNRLTWKRVKWQCSNDWLTTTLTIDCSGPLRSGKCSAIVPVLSNAKCLQTQSIVLLFSFN